MIKLNDSDYRTMISNRAENIRGLIWRRGRDGVALGNGWDDAPAPVQQNDGVVPPDFVKVRDLLSEIQQLVEEFELSIGPA